MRTIIIDDEEFYLVPKDNLKSLDYTKLELQQKYATGNYICIIRCVYDQNWSIYPNPSFGYILDGITYKLIHINHAFELEEYLNNGMKNLEGCCDDDWNCGRFEDWDFIDTYSEHYTYRIKE